METDKGETVPAFAEIKYSYPSSKKESRFTYDAIGNKVKNLFDFLHKDDTKRWIKRSAELGVSWERIFIFCISVWTYPKDFDENIIIDNDGKTVIIKALSEKYQQQQQQQQQQQGDEDDDDDDESKPQQTPRKGKKKKARSDSGRIKLEPVALDDDNVLDPQVTLVL